jgi:hypothetical protein
MDTGPEQKDFLYYLQIEKKLPYQFFLLFDLLSEASINLFKVSKNELLTNRKKKTNNLLVMTNSLREKSIFENELRDFFWARLKQTQQTIIHFSSYSDLNLNPLKRPLAGQYVFVPMPISEEKLIECIDKKIRPNLSDYEKWPGGQRGSVQVLKGEL